MHTIYFCIFVLLVLLGFFMSVYFCYIFSFGILTLLYLLVFINILSVLFFRILCFVGIFGNT